MFDTPGERCYLTNMGLINRFNIPCLLLSCLMLVSSCDDKPRSTEWNSTGTTEVRAASAGEVTLTIADIDPDTPINRIRKIRPLADYLASGLGWEEARVRVRIARNVDEIVALLDKGEIDLFIDSSYPSILVADKSGSRIALESLVDGARTYQSVIITLASANISNLQQLDGTTIALQEEYSTSGHLLPGALLLKTGFKLQLVENAQDNMNPGTIGYLYSGDEENTLSMVRKGIVHAGALSSQDYEQLPTEVKKEFSVLARSDEVPRKLASLRQGLNEGFSQQLIELLLSISDQDRLEMTTNNGWNWQFAELDEQSHQGIATIREMITQLEETSF